MHNHNINFLLLITYYLNFCVIIYVAYYCNAELLIKTKKVMTTIENILILSDNCPGVKVGKCTFSELKDNNIIQTVERQAGVSFKRRFNVAKEQLIYIIKYN